MSFHEENQDYRDFLLGKAEEAEQLGFDIEPGDVHPILLPHQKAMVEWAVKGGRRAIFAAFGLGKTILQLETLRLILEQEGGRGLIVAPLGVRQEFLRDSKMIDIDLRFIRSLDECGDAGIYITNYETVRDGKLDPKHFTVTSLDEASVLRGFGGTKTFREFMRLFEGVQYRFVATATPSPNEYIELLAYSAYLGIMDVGEGKTRFFKRDSAKADKLTLHQHRESDFWHWIASWALFVERPSDLGYSDEGYILPDLEVVWHQVDTNDEDAGHERSGQGRMFRDAALGVQEAAKEKRDSLDRRIEAMREILEESPDDHFLIWHDLEAERHAIESTIDGVRSVYGSQDLDERGETIIGFSEGDFQYLAAKPVIAGSGCNFQHHCHRAIFLGIGFKFNDFIQAIHRIQRFMQSEPVRIDLIYTSAESRVRQILEEKWKAHKFMVSKMTGIIREHGLSQSAAKGALIRGLGVDRVEVRGETFCVVNNDCVDETRRMSDNSVHLTITSIPFANQYEYTPNLCDFGHSRNNSHFWDQMDFLIPELLRITKPGRVAAIHVKDRITPGGINGLGFQTVTPFSDECSERFRRHGWAFLARKTIVTDVVRENNQTYRLGWTEQCKDGSRMGAGLPEYVMLFRKPPTDLSNGYADDPVVKHKPRVIGEDGKETEWQRKGTIVPNGGYSRSRWQIDAHGFSRSSGDRPIAPEDFEGIPHDAIFKLFRKHSLTEIQDHELHVRLCEALEANGMLPVTFMLLQPQSWHPDVWSDIARMRTLNMTQTAKGKENHLCPLQFDIVDRLIDQLSMPGETVFDPFGGLMTVPYCAVKKGRFGMGCELSPEYFRDGVAYVDAAAREASIPTLFDLLEAS